LADCYRNSLKLAVSLGAKSIAFPAISTGAFGYPLERAAQIALTEMMQFEGDIKIIAVCYSTQDYKTYLSVREELEDDR
jgi:O-acetyl-ADP-ribose deacetylase (regulator of RNase III)